MAGANQVLLLFTSLKTKSMSRVLVAKMASIAIAPSAETRKQEQPLTFPASFFFFSKNGQDFGSIIRPLMREKIVVRERVKNENLQG